MTCQLGHGMFAGEQTAAKVWGTNFNPAELTYEAYFTVARQSGRARVAGVGRVWVSGLTAFVLPEMRGSLTFALGNLEANQDSQI